MPASRIGHYRLLEKIGEGGMGSVFKAEDERLKRFVAIKLLPAEAFGDPDLRSRFLQEARAASALNHPNVITIHDVGAEGEQPFIVMELASGRPLHQVMSRRGLPVAEALGYARQIADALRAAHNAGILHRDLKPSNVIVLEDGRVKLVDFGLAKFFESPLLRELDTEKSTEARHVTREGITLGTPAYMSPEQATGGKVDARSDIFAFGIVLYEMLLGRHPFPQGAAAHFVHQPDDAASRTPSLGEAVPEFLQKILARSLERVPEKRYQTADALFEALSQPWSGAPGAGSRRRARTAGVVAALVLAAAVLSQVVSFSPPEPGSIPDTMHLAVLPFTTLEPSDAPGDHALRDGLTETLASKLTQLEQSHRSLWVVPFSEVRSLGTTSVAEARRAFAVNLALTGSIQYSGDAIRLTLNLVDARSLRQVASTILDGNRRDLIALQDTAAFRLAGMLRIELEPRSIAALTSAPAGARAQELYLEGRGHLQRYDQLERLETAVQRFRQALLEDPSHLLARASLGEAYWRLYEHKREAVFAEEAIAASERAVALGPDSPAAIVTLGLVQVGTGRPGAAVPNFLRALEIEERNLEARRGLAQAYESLGRFEEAEKAYREAVAFRPEYWDSHGQLGVFYWRRGEYDRALEQFQKVIQLTPDNHRGYANLGGILYYLGRTEEARAMFERSIAVRPSYEAYSNLGTLLFAEARYARAAEVYEEALSLDASDYQVVMNLANAYYWSGQKTAASTNYERALAMVRKRLLVNPTDPYLLVSLAQLASATGRREEARATLARLEPLPDDVELLIFAAEAYLTLDDRARAVDLVRQALERGYPAETLAGNPSLKDVLSERERRSPPR